MVVQAELTAQIEPAATEYAARVCAAADQLPAATTAVLWMGNWVEMAAAIGIGDADRAGALLAALPLCSCGHGLPHCDHT